MNPTHRSFAEASMRAPFSRLALVALTGLLAASCHSSTEPNALAPASFKAQWQGRDWQGRASATLWRDTLFIFGVREVHEVTSAGVYEEAVRIRVPFQGVGHYALDSTAVEIQEIVGGDVVSVSYSGVGSSVGALDVTAYGGPGGNVDGTVHFDVRRARSPSSPILPFENGQFRASVLAP